MRIVSHTFISCHMTVRVCLWCNPFPLPSLHHPAHFPAPTSRKLSDMAAAIILSAPAKRRRVFLKSSTSIDGDAALSLTENKALKRRSWHVERVCRVIAQEEDFSSLPSLPRSVSSDACPEKTHVPSDERLPQQETGKLGVTKLLIQ